MRTFKAFLFLECRRFFSKRNIIIIVVFLALSLYFTSTGIRQYESLQKRKKEFQEVESQKVQNFKIWDQYGGYGLDIMFIPSKLSVFS